MLFGVYHVVTTLYGDLFISEHVCYTEVDADVLFRTYSLGHRIADLAVGLYTYIRVALGSVALDVLCRTASRDLCLLADEVNEVMNVK